MSQEPVLQPNVCCLGNPVAGNPTQFVMNRLARSLGLDWRFFTSQVAIDQFEVAFRGVQALGFDGMALFEPFQSMAVPMFHSVTEAAIGLNKISVARSDANSWLGDNTLGFAISNVLLSELGGAPNSVLVIGPTAVARAIQLSENSWTTKSKFWVIEDDGIEHEAVTKLTFETIDAVTEPVDAMIIVEPMNPSKLRKLNVPFSQNARMLILDQANADTTQLTSFAKDKGLQTIEQVSMMAHQAAADFHFWTGVHANVESIRESLEEYLQW